MIDKPDKRTRELKNRAREIERTQDQFPKKEMDAQELAEREQAAKAYGRENERHFVSYLEDCVKQSVTSTEDIRRTWAECYAIYKEDRPVSWNNKESWQAQIVIPKPFATVQFGAAAVKKAFSPKFLSIQNPKSEAAGRFWMKVMEDQLNEQHGNFQIRFTDATTMGLAIGISQEMIPRFVPKLGLQYCLTEPWKIHRDPDSMSRDNQSGMYWIHQEYLDWFVLKEGEKKGQFRNVDQCVDTTEAQGDEFLSRESIAARKKQIWQRSDFRKMVLTSEFWGTILDSKGNLLLPNARFTVAGGRVIRLPQANLYPSLRWPGNAFSPLPDLLCFGGRGLLEGIRSVWLAMNDIMCLHNDYLSWVINPMIEMNIDAFENPEDVATHPGKRFLTHDTPNGQQSVRTVDRRLITNEVLANLQYLDQSFQRGSMVSDGIQGLPGYRKDITYRESAQNLDQSLGVFSLMGENIEFGAICAILAGAEMIFHHAGYDDYARIFTREELDGYGITRDPDPARPGRAIGVLPIDGAFHVSGMQALMREQEALANIRSLILPLLEGGDTAFSPFVKPYRILKAIETRTNLRDENIIVDEKEAAMIEQQQYQQLADQAAAADRQQELAEASAAADLMGKIDGAGKAPATPAAKKGGKP